MARLGLQTRQEALKIGTKRQRLSTPQWTWRMGLPMPWGQSLEHPLPPLQLLDLPLAFTQNSLLSPDDFVKQAGERGVQIKPEHLLELHRRRALVPLLRIVQRPPRTPTAVPVAASAVGGYTEYRTPLDLVITAAQAGHLVDPGLQPFRRWDGGLPLPAHGRIHRYPSVFYSPYQLLALQQIEQLVLSMTVTRAAGGHLTCTLGPLTREEVAALDGCRRLAILLSALDMHYLPRILLRARHGRVWEQEDPQFEIKARLDPFGLAPESLAWTAEALLRRASSRDPLGKWYDLIRLATPATWSGLRGDALLAMDYRIAAEILLRGLDDLDRGDLSKPPPRTGRMYKAVLDDRLLAEPGDLEGALADRGLSPHPALLLVLEGETEMLLMPRVLTELYGKPVPPALIDPVDMKSIDRDLDLLVRHVAGPKLGNDHGDFVLLTRPPTRILVAVDPEKRFATKQQQRNERDKLVRRLHESLPAALRSPEALTEMGNLVEVTPGERSPGSSPTSPMPNWPPRSPTASPCRLA